MIHVYQLISILVGDFKSLNCLIGLINGDNLVFQNCGISFDLTDNFVNN